MGRVDRRAFLAGAVALAAVGCGREGGRRPSPPPSEPAAPADASSPAAESLPAPTATVRPRGSLERLLLGGSPWETQVSIHGSGLAGPAAMVLGGVHGNEPGGWLAADEVASWRPLAGTLVIVPRANVLAMAGFVRTTNELGDLNRLYPGNPESQLPMERMAAAILALAREFEVKLLLDMHESWAFYAEYPPGSGTGALGQTITAGVGPLQANFARQLAERVNPRISDRERMLVRDGTPFSRPTSGSSTRGRSSLSAGGHVAGLTPVLIEMGQEDQALERRVELHLRVARAALELVGVV